LTNCWKKEERKMITMDADRLVEDYLKSLKGELRGLPSTRRGEILEEVNVHIAEARAGLTTEVEIRTMLERLGPPEEIAAEAKQRFGIVQRPGAPILEIATIVLLLVPVAGWVLSSVLVWFSTIWTKSDKIVGTIGALAFIPIGAISFAVPSGADQSPVGSPVVDAPVPGVEVQIVLTVALAMLIPLGVAIFLAARLRSRRQATTTRQN
jgi:uncharacterized membrane protein